MTGKSEEIPYCIISDEFEVESERFQVLLYPRGRFVRDYSYSSTEGNAVGAGMITGPASAYLRYLPRAYGDEIDIAWKLRLVDISGSEDKGGNEDDTVSNSKAKKISNGRSLSVATSGGLPKSPDTWSAAMTFCTEMEAVESVGRATDWGSSSWSAEEVCRALGSLRAEGEMTVFDRRRGESVLAWPPASKGGIGAVRKAAGAGDMAGREASSLVRDFRVGEVIVPTEMKAFAKENQLLRKQFIYPGVDYRIMTMADGEGNPIFSTESLAKEEKPRAQLALRPCGWKLQSQLSMWAKDGMSTEWPVEVKAGLLSNVSLTRFNPGSAIPRVIAAFQRDWVAYTFALLVALSPIPVSLVARNLVSFYAIPSASMEPTLLKGDVLLVEKFPGVYQRTKRGDVVLFKPPQTLRDIVNNNGSQLSSTSLFVKRIVGLPGDRDLKLVEENNVMINGSPAVGPDRSLCADEPLRLIDKLLENGKGKGIDELERNDVYVLGDCKDVSVDSRVFGTLPKENIAGKPIARIWPLNRFKISSDF